MSRSLRSLANDCVLGKYSGSSWVHNNVVVNIVDVSILVCEYVGSIVSVICVQLVAVSRKVYFSTVKNEYFIDN